MTGPGRTPALLLAGALALAALAYLPGLGAPFFLDDPRNITDNPQVRLRHPLDFGTLLEVNPYADPSRRLAYWSLGVNGLLTGLTPAGLRAGNILLHLGNALLLFLLGRALLRALLWGEARAGLGAAGGAALWALHPLNSQPVLYVVQRMTLLAGGFTLLGLWLYLEGRRRTGRARFLLWGCLPLCFLLALSSKGTGVLLPAGILLLELLLAGASGLGRRALALGGTALLAGVGFLLLFLPKILDPASWGRSYTPAERVLTEGRVVTGYLGQFLLPLPGRFHLLHDPAPSTGLLSPPSTALAWLLLAALVASAFLLLRRFPLYSLAVLWFLAFHAPEAGPLPLELAYEHRNYLPLVLPCLALGAGAAVLMERSRKRFAVPVLLGALLLALAFSTAVRARAWADPASFLRGDFAASPRSARLASLSARQLKERGQGEEAEALLRRFLAENPDPVEYARGRGVADIRILLGNLRLQAGDAGGAEREYGEALKAVPGHALALWNLAMLRKNQGRWLEALEALDAITATEPYWPNLDVERESLLRRL